MNPRPIIERIAPHATSVTFGGIAVTALSSNVEKGLVFVLLTATLELARLMWKLIEEHDRLEGYALRTDATDFDEREMSAIRDDVLQIPQIR
jgi:hypothetical protein